MKKAILITLCVTSGWMFCKSVFANKGSELPELNSDDYKELLSTGKASHCKDCQKQKQQVKTSKTVPKPRQKVRSQPVVKKKAPQPPALKAAATPKTVSPSPNPPTQIQPSDMFAPLSGRSVVWSINPYNYIPRNVIGCPQNRIDSFCMGRDYKLIHEIFGPAQHATHDTWSYTGMKVKYIAGGGRHSVVHIGFLNGKVCRVTTGL